MSRYLFEMGRSPVISGKEAARRLERAGFILVRQISLTVYAFENLEQWSKTNISSAGHSLTSGSGQVTSRKSRAASIIKHRKWI
jgi:hypothetical protein